MRYIWIIVLLLTAISLGAINFHPITDDKVVAILDLESIESNGFEIVEITTVRDRYGEIRTETWRGIRFRDVIQRWTHLKDWNYEFVASDDYLVRLNIQDIANFAPIIAIERNGVPLEEGRWRLISPNMPDMFWVSHISDIYERNEVAFEDPVRIIPYQTHLSQMRLYTNPEPFVDVLGYRFSDIFYSYDSAYLGHIRLVSKDGVEQVLLYPDYLKNAYLIIDNDIFSIQCPDMPTGMWLKDLLLIQTERSVILFHDRVDLLENKAYRDFIERISQYKWMESKETGFDLQAGAEITDWENIDWTEVFYLTR